ncbi:MAG: hypothetical protein B7Y80_04510 [Hyphomicrobium sp. 32-62-53]|nr:MAG: hypothetical protein B7Z29_05760 [Hyphomicrobium sp. 12-62-95]OYY01165.1 MAG: hypothetical protein B7Y80_04510 [Hyphomicrobium sp. 32-62-53]
MSNITKAICESLTVVELLRRGWHVVNLNAVNNTPNADLIAIKASSRITLQVKGTDGRAGQPFPHTVSFARSCEKFLTQQTPFFNSKQSPVQADFFVGVTQAPGTQSFLIMPISAAESLAREIASWWYQVPTVDGRLRSPNFAALVAIREEGIIGGQWRCAREAHFRKAAPYIDNWGILDDVQTSAIGGT